MSKKPESPEKAKRRPFHEEFAEKVIKHLKEGTAPWMQPWHPGKTLSAPHNPASGTVYRGMNRVNLAMSGFDDPRWMTWNQAQNNGMSILPGSKATPVVYFQFSKEQDRLDKDGNPVLGEDGKPEKQTVQLDKPLIRFAQVFNAKQIDGIPPVELTGKSFEWEPVEKAESILAASGANINHDQSNRAFYRYNTDSIHLPPRENFEEPGLYYGTALHELGHWTRHSSRLDRENGPFGSEMYAREELRVEIASWMLGQDVGIPHDPEQHAAYVNSWIKALEDDPYEIVRACRDAEQIKEYVLGLERNKEISQEQTVERPAKVPERKEGIAAMGVPANPATEKTFLAVPYKEKNQAKKLGAKWDKENKLWFAPEGTDLNQLSAWLPIEKVRSFEWPEPDEQGRGFSAQVKRAGMGWEHVRDAGGKPIMFGTEREAQSHAQQFITPPAQERARQVLPPQEEFALALEQAGLDLRGKSPLMDGKIHRVPLIGRNGGDLDGAYCGFMDERPAGWMQNFSSGEKHTWAASGHKLSKEELEAQRAEIARKRVERQQLILERQQQTARDAHAEWIGHDWASDDNPYLQAKGVKAFGVREEVDGTLLVPAMTVDKELRGLQTIAPDGAKSFMYGMEKNGNFHLITGENSSAEKDFSQGEILLAEGYATGATLHMATEKPVAVAFDAGNLEPVARKLREKFPNASITICADNDHQHTRRTPDGGKELWNKGVVMAQDAAKAVGGKAVAPIFNEEERARGLTDFNDLHQSRGIKEVQKQLGMVLEKDKEKSREKGQTRELSL